MIRSFVLASLLLSAANAAAQTVPSAAVPGQVSVARQALPPSMPSEPPAFALAVDGPAIGAPAGGRPGRGEVVVIRQEDARKARFRWKVEPAGRNAADADDFGGAFPEGTIDFRRGQPSGAIAFEVRGLPDRPYPRGFRVKVTEPGGTREAGGGAEVEMFIFDEAEAFRPRNDGAAFGAKPS